MARNCREYKDFLSIGEIKERDERKNRENSRKCTQCETPQLRRWLRCENQWVSAMTDFLWN